MESFVSENLDFPVENVIEAFRDMSVSEITGGKKIICISGGYNTGKTTLVEVLELISPIKSVKLPISMFSKNRKGGGTMSSENINGITRNRLVVIIDEVNEISAESVVEFSEGFHWDYGFSGPGESTPPYLIVILGSKPVEHRKVFNIILNGKYKNKYINVSHYVSKLNEK